MLFLIFLLVASVAAKERFPMFADASADEEHIREHLRGLLDPTASLTPEQLQFYYFKIYDLDKDGKLDGIEMIKALQHTHEEGAPNTYESRKNKPLLTDEELEESIDEVLRDDDFNGDGYVDFAEFAKGQKLRLIQAAAENP